MALDVTHLRFALDVRDDYGITDLSRYLSGAIYPDSRYITRISRELTHPTDFDDIPIPKDDDFRKGWETHLIYDEIQLLALSDIPGMIAGPISQGSEMWRQVTVIKLLQAAFDFQSIDFDAVIGSLCVIETPFGESREAMKRFYSDIRGMYTGKKEIDPEIFPQFFRNLGLEDDISTDVLERLERMRVDKKMMETIAGIYDETMWLYRERYR